VIAQRKAKRKERGEGRGEDRQDVTRLTIRGERLEQGGVLFHLQSGFGGAEGIETKNQKNKKKKGGG